MTSLVRVNFGITGLVGTITCTITRDDGTVVRATSASGISELPAGSGMYQLTAAYAFTDGSSYRVDWTDGTRYATDVVVAVDSSGGGGGSTNNIDVEITETRAE